MKKEVNYVAKKEDWVKAQDRAFKALNSNRKIDGFRPGKAPRTVFDKKYPDEVLKKAADDFIREECFKVAKDEDIKPVIAPNVDIVKITEDELEVNFTFIPKPEVELGEYKSLKTKKAKVSVSKEDIEKRIHEILERYAELVVKEEGVVAEGDIAIIDYEGFNDGVAFDGGKAENYSLEIGSKTFIPGFEDGIIGMKKDEEKDLNLTFPEDYSASDLAGKDVVFKVKVNEIKVREYPKLDKEFFEDLGMENVTNKKELEEEVKKELTAEKEKNAEDEYIDNLIDEVVGNAKVEIEDELVDAEAEAMYEEMIESVSAQGINEEMYLMYTGTTKESIIEHLKDEALKRLKSSYVIEAIIKEEKIAVTDGEVDEYITETAEKYSMLESEVESAFGGREYIEKRLEMDKAVELLKDE